MLLLGIALATGLLVGLSGTEALAPQAAAAESIVPRKFSDPKRGETGNHVVALQRRLRKAGALDKKYITGTFGLRTEQGVKRFQRSVKLEPTGKVGPLTWDKLVEKTGRMVAKPFKWPKKKSVRLPGRCKTSGRVLCVDKTKRKLYYVKAGKVVKTADARFGCAGDLATRNGTFRVFRKSRHHVSSLFNSPMPYAMFFSGGQAVHYSRDFARVGYNGCSHGCVNIRDRGTISYVFDRIRVGDRVHVYRS